MYHKPLHTQTSEASSGTLKWACNQAHTWVYIRSLFDANVGADHI